MSLKSLALALVVGAALVAATAASAASPANDAFAAAQELTGRMASADGLNKDATKEAGEPNHAGESGGASVWYRWTAPAGGQAVVSTCESSFDTLLGVYTGASVGGLTQVAANDDGCGLQSKVSFVASEGVTYRIAVDGDNAATGVVALALRLAPSNDDFANAATISGDEGTVDGTNEGSSRETAEPDYLTHSVWYTWTAPSSGPAAFETCGSDTAVGLVAFTGDVLGALAYVSSNYDDCNMYFNATAGATYRIAVDGYDETGAFELAWSRSSPPPEPPYAEVSPQVTGVAQEGQTLTGSNGEWWGTPPFSFTYAWGRCDANYVRCALLTGATSTTYALTMADVGYHVYFRVTATNAAGSYTEYSIPTELVRPRGPVSAVLPSISGDTIVGESLFTTDGIWTGPQPMQFSYQWQACDASGGACIDLPGARASFIELEQVHVGRRLRVVVTATNVDGSRAVASDASAVVVPGKATGQARCVVPNVRGRSLKQAKSRIQRAHCKPGRVSRAYSRSVRRGKVISQTPRPGARMKQGARVGIVVSKGRKR